MQDNDIERIDKLVSLVFIAFAWRNKIGIHIDLNGEKIKIKEHGYRAKSLFKIALTTS